MPGYSVVVRQLLNISDGATKTLSRAFLPFFKSFQILRRYKAGKKETLGKSISMVKTATSLE